MSISKKNREDQTIDTLLDELESLVMKMESGHLSLEESVASYRTATEIADACQKKLSTIQQEIAVLDTKTQTLTDYPAEQLT